MGQGQHEEREGQKQILSPVNKSENQTIDAIANQAFAAMDALSPERNFSPDQIHAKIGV